MDKITGFNSLAVHGGEKVYERSVTQPIFQSSTYVFEGEERYVDVKYGRLANTPNHRTLAEKISALEKTEDALVVASGMAAITCTLLATVASEGHLLVQDQLYGGTHYFLKDDFPFWGRQASFFSTESTDQLGELFRSNTQAVYVETLSNPLLKVPDLERVVDLAHRNGALAIIDNTFASPYNFNPKNLGFDLIIHSATKYLNGHTDVLAGAVAGSKELIEKIRTLACHLGPSLDPHACFLLNRGIKTLGLRMKQQNQNALELAHHLQKLSRVERVYYPGLENDSSFSRAKTWFRGAGGMLSFDFKGSVTELETALDRLQIPMIAPSLGGVESLVTRPSTTTHSGISNQDRNRLGIKDTLVRVSVGIEDVEDLKDDFTEALGS